MAPGQLMVPGQRLVDPTDPLPGNTVKFHRGITHGAIPRWAYRHPGYQAIMLPLLDSRHESPGRSSPDEEQAHLWYFWAISSSDG